MDLTAFGFEHEDGSIHYICSGKHTIEELNAHMRERIIPKHLSEPIRAQSVDDFFCETLFEKEKTLWRLVYLLDGSTICRNIHKEVIQVMTNA